MFVTLVRKKKYICQNFRRIISLTSNRLAESALTAIVSKVSTIFFKRTERRYLAEIGDSIEVFTAEIKFKAGNKK